MWSGISNATVNVGFEVFTFKYKFVSCRPQDDSNDQMMQDIFVETKENAGVYGAANYITLDTITPITQPFTILTEEQYLTHYNNAKVKGNIIVGAYKECMLSGVKCGAEFDTQC